MLGIYKKRKRYVRLKAIKPSSKKKYAYVGDASGYIKVVPIRKKVQINKLKIKKATLK